MKKVLLSIVGLLTMNVLLAQVSIQIDGAGADVSGTIVNVNVDASTIFPYEEHFIVTNNTGVDAQWRITRVKASVPAMWSDQVCWPPTCYVPSGTIYSTPNTGPNPAPIIVDGTAQTTNSEVAELKPRITPDQTINGTALYWYYLTDNSGNYVDSVGLQINFLLGVEEIEEEVSVQIAPNPATNLISVQTKGISKGTIKLVDVLGNVVYKDIISGTTKKIDVSEFGNGVYFVIIETPGEKTLNRKLIVRH